MAVLAVFSGAGARAGYLASVDQGLISVTNFLATIVLARAVSPTELGVYGVGFTSLRLVRAIQEGISIQPVNAFGAALDDGDFRTYASGTTLIQLAFALGSSGLFALTGYELTRLGNDTAGPAIFALYAPVLFWQLQEYLRRLLYARRDVPGALLNTVFANGIRLALLAWWSFQGDLTGIAGLYAIALGSLFALIPGVWQTRSYWTLRGINLGAVWRKNWDFGRWIIGGMLANWISVEFYPVLTAGMISFAAAGAYRALQNLVAPIHMLLRAMDTFLTPRAALDYERRGQSGLVRLLRLAYLGTGPAVLGLLAAGVVFRKPLLVALYGDTYLEYSSGMVLMALFYGLLYAYWPLQAAFKAARWSRPLFLANLAAMAVMFTFGLWAILEWGVFGTILGQALNALVVLLVLVAVWRSHPPGR